MTGSKQSKIKLKQTVYIVEDDRATSVALRDLLKQVKISELSYPSAEEFLAAWTPSMAGCLLLDVRLPA
jgi:FixJ family two-component response regulator